MKSESKSHSNRPIASLKEPLIQAVAEGTFSFKTESDALDKIDYIKNKFMKSRHLPEGMDDKVIIWIRGFALTEDESSKGYQGNYAIVYHTQKSDGKYTILAQKIEADLKCHPVTKRALAKHPDWGYYILRKVKKGYVYKTIDELNDDIVKLAEDFPKVSIPCTNKLYTVVYRKHEDRAKQLTRYVFEAEKLSGGGVCSSLPRK